MLVILGPGAPGTAGAGLTEESHPGLGLESLYSEAVLAFNRKQANEALRILDGILKQNPNHIESLELKALTLKAKGDEVKSIVVYERLLALKPIAERGAYHFELGVLLQQQKKNDQAKPHFEKAIELQTNVGPSHLFLGLILFTANDIASAKPHFEALRKDQNPEMQMVGRYYLGLIHFKNGYGGGGTSELMAARSIASDMPDNKMAQDIKAGIEKILAPFSKSQWYGNVAFLTQYDSNISQIPSVGEITPTAASGKSTLKLQLVGSVGRMSSPMRTVQIVGGYRVAVNKNLNGNTKTYEFATNTLTFYANVKPLSETTWGLKAEGAFSFQNRLEDSSTNAYTYGRYNFGGEFGPYIRSQFSPSWTGQLDVFLRPQKYYEDTSLSGQGLYTRLSARKDGGIWWNPSFVAGFESNDTQSDEYRSQTLAFTIADTAKLSGSLTLTFGLDLLLVSYKDSALKRSDRSGTLRASVLRTLTPTMSLLGDLSLTNNVSTVPEAYSYNKVLLSAGISWTL